MYIRALDGLRGISILLVMLFHARVPYFTGGFIGVEIFFILSGFLVSRSFDQHKNIFIFYKRRLFRILPALFFFLFIYLIFNYFLYGHVVVIHYISVLLFFSNWLISIRLENLTYLEHMWSLAIEEQFYLFFPLIFLHIKNTCFFIFFSFIFLILSKYIFILTNEGWTRFYYATDTRICSILFGVSTYIFMKNYNDIFVRVTGWIKTIFIFQVMSLLVIFIVSYKTYWGDVNYVYYWRDFIIVATLILILLSSNNNIINIFLKSDILVYVGKISFSLYIWHYFIFRYLRNYADFNSYEILFYGSVLSVFCAFLSYRYIELNFVKQRV